MKNRLIILLLFVFIAAFVVKSTDKSTKQFEWLKGGWIMKTKKGNTITENWSITNDSTLAGESLYISSAGISTVSETLELVYRNGSYYYISTVKNQNNNEPVNFTITNHSGKGFIAENSKHDFPKRIVYELVTADSLHAYIDDGVPDTKKVQHFYYVRQKN